MTTDQERSKYTAIGMLAIPIWGCILPLIKLASEAQGLFSAIVSVQGISGICGLSLMLYRKQLLLTSEPYRSKAFILRLALFVVHIFAIYFAVRVVQRQHMPGVVFCNYLWPSLVLIYSVLIAQLIVPRVVMFSLGLAIVTLALFIEFGWRGFHQAFDAQSMWGLVGALVAANAWGLYSAITRRYGSSSGGSGVTPLFQLCVALLAGLALLAGAEQSSNPGAILSWPVLAAGFGNFVAYLVWDLGVRKGNIITLSLLADFIPWLSLVATSFILGIGIESHTKISAAVLVVGAVISRIGTLARRT